MVSKGSPWRRGQKGGSYQPVVACELAVEVSADAINGVAEGSVGKAREEVVDVGTEGARAQVLRILEREGGGGFAHGFPHLRGDRRQFERLPYVAGFRRVSVAKVSGAACPRL